MDNYQGDLTDIVRGTGCGPQESCAAPPVSSSTTQLSDHLHHHHPPTWKFSTSSDQLDFTPSSLITNAFGDPFSIMRDPLLTELDASNSSSNYFGSPTTSGHDQVDAVAAAAAVPGPFYSAGNVQSIFPRMQISPKVVVSPPCGSPAVMAPSSQTPRGGVKAPAVVPNDMMINGNSSKGCFLDASQISSPRNLGIKKRKCQAKKVVCIPAPAAANSRSSGEVVPSDLWAWRKYGQKPIKGSPYPRGYYRCSSSKGCSARKQVERSRTDPNMLVITYTSEHNHPWPTQRNALAGSARAQPSSKATNKNFSPSPTTSSDAMLPPNDPIGGTTTSVLNVKQEMEDEMEKDLEEDHDEIFSDHYQGFPLSYKPTLPDSGRQHQPEDFFADLHELDPELLFPRGEDDDADDQKKKRNNNNRAGGGDLDFSFFDWPDQDA